jgi:hypothetical protein
VTESRHDRLADVLRRLDSPVVPFLIALLLGNLFGVAILRRNGYDRSRLVVAGDKFADPAGVPAGLFVFPRSDGYDGQYFYRLSLDPFTSKRTDFGVTLDNPSYRQRRILMPLIAWIVSLGEPARVPSILLALNLTALAAAGWIGGVLARLHGRHALWGLTLALYPGFLLSTARDLAEVVASVLALAALVLIRSRRYAFATVTLVLASLTRETTLLVALGISASLAFELVRRLPRSIPAYVALVPLVVQFGWQAALARAWGTFSADPQKVFTPIPFEGPVRLVAFILEQWNWLRGVWLVEIAMLAVVATLALASLRSSSSARHEKAAYVLSFLLAIMLGANIWVEDWGFMRALSEFYVLGTVVVLGAGRGARATLAAVVGVVYALLFFDLTLGWH